MSTDYTTAPLYVRPSNLTGCRPPPTRGASSASREQPERGRHHAPRRPGPRNEAYARAALALAAAFAGLVVGAAPPSRAPPTRASPRRSRASSSTRPTCGRGPASATASSTPAHRGRDVRPRRPPGHRLLAQGAPARRAHRLRARRRGAALRRQPERRGGPLAARPLRARRRSRARAAGLALVGGLLSIPVVGARHPALRLRRGAARRSSSTRP